MILSKCNVWKREVPVLLVDCMGCMLVWVVNLSEVNIPFFRGLPKRTFTIIHTAFLYYRWRILFYNIVSNISCKFLCKIKMQYLPIFLLFFLYQYTRGGATRWCRVQKFACYASGSRHQYIVIWWDCHYGKFQCFARPITSFMASSSR